MICDNDLVYATHTCSVEADTRTLLLILLGAAVGRVISTGTVSTTRFLSLSFSISGAMKMQVVLDCGKLHVEMDCVL